MATTAEQRSFGEKAAWTSRTVFAIGTVALVGAAVLAPPLAAEGFTDAAILAGVGILLSQLALDSASNKPK